MLVVGVACDPGVRGVPHKGAFKPLNELTLEATDVSIVNHKTLITKRSRQGL